MNVMEMRNELSKRGKNGVAFLSSAVIIWLIVTVIFSQSINIELKNTFMLFSTGLMFPLSILISKAMKSEWKTNDNPLGILGLTFNLAQLFYFPILFWAFAKSPNEMILFFAIITGAHFFPYGWLYNTKAYYVMAPVISISVTVIAWVGDETNRWTISLAMVIFLIIIIIWLVLDLKNKR